MKETVDDLQLINKTCQRPCSPGLTSITLSHLLLSLVYIIYLAIVQTYFSIDEGNNSTLLTPSFTSSFINELFKKH